MTAYTMLWLVVGISFALTLIRYIIKKPSNLFIAYLQDFIGVLFILSSFVKGVDPLGFSYKLDEYFEVFADVTKNVSWFSSLMEDFRHISLYLSIFMIVLEMLLGWMLIFGLWMKITSWLLLLLMLFFTFLTAFSLFTGRITDCGCFGDAIKLTNAETFWKDVALTLLILIIFFYQKKLMPLFPKAVNLLLIIGVAGSLFLPLYCYNYLPVIDFRPYKIGNNIREMMSIPPGAPRDSVVTNMIYKDKNSGAEAGYTMKDLPWQDSVWMANHEFVRQESKVVKEGFKPKITDFKIWNDDQPDITSEVLDNPDYNLWIVAYDINQTNREAFNKIAVLARECQQHNIKVIGLTSSSYSVTDALRHEANADFPFYYSDGVVLKTIIRANPGVVLLKGGTVIGKWHYHCTPTYEKLNKKYFKGNEKSK